MKILEHGIGVLTKRVEDKIFIELIAIGKLMRSDYETTAQNDNFAQFLC